jgi:hypothetical protein
MDKVWQDLRYAARMLAKNPGFTALALLSMAIGIGINSTAFSIIDCIFLRSMPVKDPNQLVWIYSRKQGQYRSFSYPAYQDLSRDSKSFEGIAAVSRHGAQLNLNGEIEIIRADWVSGNFFSVLGIKPAMGRWFAAADKKNPGEDPPVVISYGFWQRRFGSDPAVVGKTIVLSRRSFIIRAVAPPSFVGLLSMNPTETWFLLDSWVGAKDLQSRDSHYVLGERRACGGSDASWRPRFCAEAVGEGAPVDDPEDPAGTGPRSAKRTAPGSGEPPAARRRSLPVPQ